ncbi:hypothetical protein Aperf_G00000127155 [Anoplocephala perfoliata]
MEGEFFINISGCANSLGKRERSEVGPNNDFAKESNFGRTAKSVDIPSKRQTNKKGEQEITICQKPIVNNKFTPLLGKSYPDELHSTSRSKNKLTVKVPKNPEDKIGIALRLKKNASKDPNISAKVGNRDKLNENGLKFIEEPVGRNPLQIGLSAKQHPAQQELLCVIGEPVNPSIESIFSGLSWDSFGSRINLHSRLISIIQNKFKFKNPTSIQASSIKNLMDGRDALVKAQTGSGKTLAYALPMLHDLMIAEPPITRQNGPKSLIILPTRELATQTYSLFTQLCGACVRIVPGCLIGGAKRKHEKASIRKGLNIIVTTPRRLLDHLSKTSSLHLNFLKWLVIDEADRLVELGFERDVRRIIDQVVQETTPEGGESSVQTVLLSATLTAGVENLAGLALKNPVKCEVSDESNISGQSKGTAKLKSLHIEKNVAQFSLPSGLKHFVLVIPCKQRLVALAAFLLLKAKYNRKSGKLIVFFATQDCVDFHHRLFSETLCKDGSEVDADIHGFKANSLHFYRLHGNMDPKERQTVFQEFANCPNGILLTTDVASRGLDLAGVSWVVLYHVSGTPVDYVHRVGRTARAGGRGKALLFLQPEEESFIQLLASTVGVDLKRLKLSDVLQTALYHLQTTKKKVGMRTIEEAASSMSQYFLQTVNEEGSELKVMAERAYMSFIRAYASFSGEMRAHFTFRRLHLGHVARAFCLNEKPSEIGRNSNPTENGKKRKNSEDYKTEDPRTVKKSRHLQFGEEQSETGYEPSKKRRKTNPNKLAELNMLAEYGL